MSEFNFEDELLELYKVGYFHRMGHDVCGGMLRQTSQDDFAHDLYCRCMVKRHLYKHESIAGLRGWIYRLAWNFAYGVRRRELQNVKLAYYLGQRIKERLVYVDGDEAFNRILINQIISLLPIKMQKVQLGILMGFKHRELVTILERPQGTIDSQSARLELFKKKHFKCESQFP